MKSFNKKFNKWILGQGMVVYACNPSYSGGCDRRIVAPGQPRQKVFKTPFQQTSQVWRYKTLIPGIKGEGGKICSKADPDNKCETLSKK
jgi:hypothetical protein